MARHLQKATITSRFCKATDEPFASEHDRTRAIGFGHFFIRKLDAWTGPMLRHVPPSIAMYQQVLSSVNGFRQYFFR